MAANASYLFRGQTVGPNGVVNDAIDIPEMMYAIQKKFLGIPNTIPDILYSSEFYPSVSGNVPNAFPNIHQLKMYSQVVPLSNPASGRSPIGTVIFDPTTSTIDPVFVNSNFPSFFGYTMSNDLLSSRWVCNSYPYICFYSNVLLTSVYQLSRFQTTNYSNFATSYGHPLLVNSISGRYDVTYLPRLYTNNGLNTYIEVDGYWQLDNDTGIVMFFDNNTIQAQVTAANAPRMSFYRYEGLFGEASVTQGQYL
jgi:hypothetical protein